MQHHLQTDNRLTELLCKKQAGIVLSGKDEQYLQQWASGHTYRQQLLNELANEKWLQESGQYLQSLPQDDNRWSRLQAMIDNAEKKPAKLKKIFPFRWQVAASVILLITSGIIAWYFGHDKNKELHKAQAVAAVHEIQPGRDGALLTLANGEQVLLDTIENGIVALQGGATARVANGELIYDAGGATTVYNTMSTPRGRQYQLKLSDGTQVWLNNSSSITYPVNFSSTERKVEITGEAYFEVATLSATSSAGQKVPFIVQNGDMQVTVLGTHFNVNAYDDEKDIKITLLEGAVKVSNRAASRLMQPGQQATVIPGFDQESSIRLNSAVNVDQVMAWKNGLFNFNNLEFGEIMRQIERWYDVSVVYEKKVPDIALAGKMSRGITLNQLLIALERLGVYCNIEGKKLVIKG